MTKYKYYFRKPRSEIVNDILKILLITGVVIIASQSPHFGINIWRGIRRMRRYPRKKVYDNFYHLMRQGLIEVTRHGRQIYISLSEEGRKRAGYYQINDLRITRQKRWDGKWRIVVFDIAELKRVHREAFRGKLKELGFRPLQKSVWLHPFPCHDEIELLRAFFGLNRQDVLVIVAERFDGDKSVKEIFGL